MYLRLMSATALIGGLAIGTPAAQAKVQISVDLSTQRMHVTSASGSYTWKISSGRGKYNTPRGNYRPYMLKRMHYSRKYNNSPMPYSIFYSGGFAIHATYSVRALGRPASHGCIRLSPANARKLFTMVRREGARIRIHGSRAQFYANNRAKRSIRISKRQTKRNAAPLHVRKRKLPRYNARARVASRSYTGTQVASRRYARTRAVSGFRQNRYNNTRPAHRRGFRAVNSRHAPLAYAPRKKQTLFTYFRHPYTAQ